MRNELKEMNEELTKVVDKVTNRKLARKKK